jgi:Mn-dependent DtxR family transcriptional regulator
MIELTLEFGMIQADKIKLGTKRIKKLLQIHKELKRDMLKILDKDGLVVVALERSLITAYNWK